MKRLIALAISLLIPTVSQAETTGSSGNTLEGTLNVSAQPSMIKGNLAGCEFVFNSIARDWIYRDGDPIKAAGSIGIISTSGEINAIVKVGVYEMQISEALKIDLVPSMPDRVYLMNRKLDTNQKSLVTSFSSDTSGGFVSVFEISPTFGMLMEAMKTGEITLAFNKAGGAVDIKVPINLRVVDTDNTGKRTESDETIRDFALCTQRLLDNLTEE